MRTKRVMTWLVALATGVSLPGMAAATSVFGALDNFDAVNDTGVETHGFEIFIEDSNFTRADITSVFGLDRNFGVPPQDVERYGAPTIAELPGIGVKITYKASFANGAWSVGTLPGTFPNPGDSCWIFGGVGYPNISCDHFGVSTIGSPAKVSYSWLVDQGGNTGVLTPISNPIPHVAFTPTPAPPPTPIQPNPVAGVIAQIMAPAPEAGLDWGPAFWVKVFSHEVENEVHLDELVNGNFVVPGNAEIETEWYLLQSGPGAPNGELAAELGIGAAGKALVRRYEFYKYTGPLNPDGSGEAMCDGAEAPGHACDNPFGDGSVQGINDLGLYIGDQIAGYNLVQPGVGNVPEPATWASLITGLGLVGGMLRRRRRSTPVVLV
nr:PEPxxWA-CTERM sorting domain-containing protein [Sandarakinorhabdus oryzae]